MTSLICAASNGRLETCKFLVSQKANVAARDGCDAMLPAARAGDALAHSRACRGGTALKNAIKNNKPDVVAYLRSIGAPE